MDRFHPTTDLVWSGWDAALIESKKVCKNGKVNQVVGKRKPKISIFMDERETKKSIDDSKGIPKFRIEFAVAILAYKAIMFLSWSTFELHFGKNKRKEVVDRLFVSAVKLVLDIFDEEDFERICYGEEIRDEQTVLYEELMAEEDYHTVIDQLQLKFPHLWESDIYEHSVYRSTQFTPFEPMDCEFVKEFMESCYFNKAQELIKEHVPLKGHLRAQLLLEHARVKCFHVTDTLLLQAIHSVDLPGLLGDDKMDYQVVLKLSQTMLNGFNSLVLDKASQLLYAEARFIVSAFNQIETCKSEVVEVIKLANLERRLQKARYTKPSHFWTALHLSRLRDGLRSMLVSPKLGLLEWPSQIFIYELCHLSRRVAKEIHKIDGEWGLEYLAFALRYGPSFENVAKHLKKYSHLFERLCLCESQYPVESWKNADVFMVLMGKRSRYGVNVMCKAHEVMNKLREGVETGYVQLPKDEELRSIN